MHLLPCIAHSLHSSHLVYAAHAAAHALHAAHLVIRAAPLLLIIRATHLAYTHAAHIRAPHLVAALLLHLLHGLQLLQLVSTLLISTLLLHLLHGLELLQLLQLRGVQIHLGVASLRLCLDLVLLILVLTTCLTLRQEFCDVHVPSGLLLVVDLHPARTQRTYASSVNISSAADRTTTDATTGRLLAAILRVSQNIADQRL